MVTDTPPSRPSFSPAVRLTLRYGLSAVLTILFLWLAFRGTDFGKLLASMGGANYWWILLSFVLLIISHVIRAFRWRYLLEPIKPAIGLRNLFSAVMIGYLFNNILPRAGELARPYVIGREEGISKSAAFGTIVVERIMDTASFLFLVVMIPFVYNGPLREAFPWLTETGIIISVATGAVLIMLIIMMLRRDWTDGLLRIVGHVLPTSFGKRVDGVVHSFLDGLLFVKRPGRFFIIGLSSVLIWTLYVLMIYTAFFAFHLDDRLGLRAAIVLQAISSIGVAIPTPGATGSYHAFVGQTLTKLFSVDGAVALSYATVTHAAGFVGTTIIGLVYFFRDNITLSAAVGKSESEEA